MLMEGVGGKTKTKTCLGFCEHLTHDCYSSYLLQPTLLYSLAQCTRFRKREQFALCGHLLVYDYMGC